MKQVHRTLRQAASISRRTALQGLMGTAAMGLVRGAGAQGVAVGDSERLTDLGMPLSAAQRAAGAAFLLRYPSIDIHAHPGRFFLRDLPFESPTLKAFGAPFEPKAIAELRAGEVSAVLIAAVADARLLEATPQGLHAGKEFGKGEAYADYRSQLKRLNALFRDPRLVPGDSPYSVIDAFKAHRSAAVFAIEGGDFIEDRLDRVHEAYSEGVRAVTLVHYHVNQIGDIQTEEPVHNGLTPLGGDIVREMNRLGMLIDLAHATLAVTRDVLKISRAPVLVSHTALATPTANHPRLISAEHAKLVADAGGIIGAWPSGLAGLTSFADYIDAIMRLVEVVGVEHAAIGTDMDANYKPVLRSYLDWNLIPAALLARGLHEAEVAKIMGGNFLRVFAASRAP